MAWLWQCSALWTAVHNYRTTTARHERRRKTCVRTTFTWPFYNGGLHWLPIETSIQYKLCLLVDLAINSTGKAPLYISNLLQSVSALPDHHIVLRSGTNLDLQVPRTRLKFGECAFSVAPPKAWNDLPLHLHAITNRVRTIPKLHPIPNIIGSYRIQYSIPVPIPVGLADSRHMLPHCQG